MKTQDWLDYDMEGEHHSKEIKNCTNKCKPQSQGRIPSIKPKKINIKGQSYSKWKISSISN
ncbi:hypothetical protein KFK09_022901 [Dendrobium nobile]|uniref:Uncharacterized protein n=1 Tax=Dendrobium nobile TaxID=94219 RepID=A0A8T3AKT3_DENNO|nr:hypothetical protein KFK09_022901 [Dendrobium nobile]